MCQSIKLGVRVKLGGPKLTKLGFKIDQVGGIKIGMHVCHVSYCLFSLRIAMFENLDFCSMCDITNVVLQLGYNVHMH